MTGFHPSWKPLCDAPLLQIAVKRTAHAHQLLYARPHYVYIYTRAERIHSTARGSGEIILTWSDIRASADESIKISHRARASRESGNISNIRRDPSSPILIHILSLSLEHRPAWSSHRTPPFLLRSTLALTPLIYVYSHFYYLGARETFFIDCPGTDLSDTGCKLFFPFTLQVPLLSSSASLSVSFGSASLFRALSTSFSPTCRAGMNT